MARRRALRSFISAPSGVGAVIALAVVILAAIFAPIFLHSRATAFDVLAANQGLSSHHVLGTDGLGRDLFYRLLVATRLSVGLAALATTIAMVLGLAIGSVTVVVPRLTRTIVQRIIDMMLAFPPILVAFFVAAVLGPGARSAVLGVAIAVSFHFARLTSTLSLAIAGRDYVLAARVIGVRGPKLIRRYFLPNIAETMIIAFSVSIGASLVAISSLSFLGLGVQSPAIDWGVMLSEGVKGFYVAPVAALAPAVCITITALASGLAGDAWARTMNPRLWTAPKRSRRSRPPNVPAIVSETLSAVPRDQLRHNGHSADAVVRARDLRVTIERHDDVPITVARGVSFDIHEAEIVGIVGESGSGKTTVALALAKLLPAYAEVTGSIEIRGQDIDVLRRGQLDRLLGREVAVIFQNAKASLNPALKIGTQMTEGPIAHKVAGLKGARDHAIEALKEVSIPAPSFTMTRYPHELSGGQAQRVMIAMGLSHDPAVLIADEPTTALDVTIQAQIIDLLLRINREHRMAVILISHNFGLIAKTCSRVLVMYAGRIVEDAPIKTILANPAHPYTQALLAAVPDIHRPSEQALETIPGTVPDVANLPGGCAFHPRCPLAMDRCRTEDPPLVADAHASRRVACWAVQGES